MSAPLVNPLVTVDEPAPEVAGYGLYSAATVLNPTDSHTQAGVQWESTACGTSGPFQVGCGVQVPWPLRGGQTWVEAHPFGVGAGVDCKLVGTTADHLRDLARTDLRLTEQWAIERAYWTGEVFAVGVDSPHLADAERATILSATPVSPARAIGLLEHAIGQFTGAVGVVHASRLAFGYLKGFVSENAGKMRTELGTRVAFGTGYPGTAPDGTDPGAGVTWLYATGPVLVNLGPVQDLPTDPRLALDRETNDARVHAVRIVSVGHACGLVAVPITLL